MCFSFDNLASFLVYLLAPFLHLQRPAYLNTIIMRKKLLFFLFISFTICSYSQNVIFKGNVIEEGNRMKMTEVIIEIHGTAFAETTNENGEFEFRGNIPAGDQTVIFKKKGYENTIEFLNFKQGQAHTKLDIIMKITKQEKKRRKKLDKSINKDNKKSEKEIESKKKAVKKSVEKDDKKLAQEQKKFEKQSKKAERRYGKSVPSGDVIYEDIPEEAPVETVSPLQITYGEKLGVTPQEITNIPLYQFIDEWMGTKYLWGGNSKDGIDCSFFSIKLYHEVKDELIERTAQNQYDSDKTAKWDGRNHLKEGDLLFFRKAGDLSDEIVHVGVYLANNKFVNATEFTGGDGNSGVRIDDLSVRYWQDRLFAAGRRKNY